MHQHTVEDIVRAHQYDASWNDASVVLLLSRFIADKGLGEELDSYLAEKAAEESATSEDDEDDEDD